LRAFQRLVDDQPLVLTELLAKAVVVDARGVVRAQEALGRVVGRELRQPRDQVGGDQQHRDGHRPAVAHDEAPPGLESVLDLGVDPHARSLGARARQL
jgi:ribosomal protein S18 acetylase RimI-like enzyme